MKVSQDAWVLIGVFILLVVMGIVCAQQPHNDESTISSTYNADKLGVKAFYTLLKDRMGFNAERLRLPYGEMPEKAAVLIVVQPLRLIPIEPDERIALEKWVRAGGTAVFLSDSLDNVPATFGSTRKLGRGFVYAFNSRAMITNRGMRDYHNALKVLDIITKHADRNDLILFDEYHHGLGIDQGSLWSLMLRSERQVKIGALIMLVVALSLIYGHGRRFGAVRRLPAAASVRPGYEFVESVGRLYDRAGAADMAAGILCGSLRHSLCLKLGLSSDVPNERIVRVLASDGFKAISRQVDNLLIHCEPGKTGQKMSKSELLHIAGEIRKIEEELGLARIDA